MNDTPPIPNSSPGPGHGRAVVLFALVTLMAYFNSLHGDYVLDDYRIVNDPKIEEPFEGDLLNRPLIAISLAINHKVDGIQSRGYHALNLAAHFLAGLFVYDLVRRTLLAPRFDGRFTASAGWIGLIVGLVWLAHPLNTQAVTYVIQRCESFMGMFLLASLWCYVRGASADQGRWWWAAATAACTLGVGCKEIMIVLPPLALLYDRTFITGSWRESLRLRKWPLLALMIPPITGIAILFLAGFFTNPSGTVGFGVKLFTPYTYALTQTQVILHYLKLSFVPVGLTLDYLDWRPCTSITQCWTSAAAIAAIVAVTAYGVIVRAAWAYPAAWFLVCLAPSSTFVPVQDAAFEHRMYLPLAGVVSLTLCGLASILLGRVPSWALGAASGGLVLVLALMTAARNEEWSSSQRLLQDNVEKRPGNTRARMNLAVQLFANGDTAGAEEQLNEARRLPLQAPLLQKQLGTVLREAGRPEEAVLVGQEMMKEDPDSADSNYELGLSLLAANRSAESLPYLRRNAELRPKSPFARMHLALALLETGSADEAAQEFAAAYANDPEYSNLMNQAARRIASDPDAKPSNLRLALLYADAANRMSARNRSSLLDTLAMCQARMGRYEEAAKTAGRAAEQARAEGDDYFAGRLELRAARFREHKPNLPEPRSDKP